MPDIEWEAPFCQDASNCFRFGTDPEGAAYIAVAGQEDRPITGTRDALRTLVAGIKAGSADHLL